MHPLQFIKDTMYTSPISIQTNLYFYYLLFFSTNVSFIISYFFNHRNELILSIILAKIYLTLLFIKLSYKIFKLLNYLPNVIWFQPSITNLHLFFYNHQIAMKIRLMLLPNLQFHNINELILIWNDLIKGITAAIFWLCIVLLFYLFLQFIHGFCMILIISILFLSIFIHHDLYSLDLKTFYHLLSW